jgi:hypothetical protein
MFHFKSRYNEKKYWDIVRAVGLKSCTGIQSYFDHQMSIDLMEEEVVARTSIYVLYHQMSNELMEVGA